MIDFDAVQAYLNRQHTSYSSDYEGGLPFSDALLCAQDIVRNRAFFEAISKAVSDLKQRFGTVTVIDAGCGTGILGFYALMAGADHCVFLDNNPDAITFTKGLLEAFDLSAHVEVTLVDAKMYQPTEPFHLLISETVSAGFVEEDFLSIVRHFYLFIESGGVVIPEAFDLTIIEQPTGDSQTFNLVSAELPEHLSVSLKNQGTQSVEFSMNSRLYGPVRLDSGECQSYCNPRVHQLSDSHRLIQFSIRDLLFFRRTPPDSFFI